MDPAYLATPFLAWLAAGGLKFALNSIRTGRLAFGLIGYGGLPSTHTAIVSSMATLVALREGIGHPAFGVAITLAFVVVLDAHSLRGQVGRQAAVINKLAASQPDHQALRERLGHSRLEIAAGIGVGVAVAVAVQWLLGR